MQASRVTTSVRHPKTGIEASQIDKIAEAFKTFYEQLYNKTEIPGKILEMKDIFENIKLPRLNQEFSEKLTTPVTEKEIEDTIKQLKSNKSPGTDELSGEFIKKILKEFTPKHCEVLNYTLKDEDPPKSWSEAIISVIYKEGKDPKNCASYRPISLLKNDAKILGAILMNRMRKYTNKLIDPDRTGFLSGRQGSNNIRRALNIQSATKKDIHPSMFLSLDAEKAFDMVDWEYLNYTMEEMGFGEVFISWPNTIN